MLLLVFHQSVKSKQAFYFTNALYFFTLLRKKVRVKFEDVNLVQDLCHFPCGINLTERDITDKL